jgi:DNA-directed RNA polymerase specialized sigma24 family protein
MTAREAVRLYYDAWQEKHGASLHSWLYRIATNRCLNALRDRGRRPHEPSEPPEQSPAPPQPRCLREPVWLSAYPDVWLEGVRERLQPEVRYETREAIGDAPALRGYRGPH